MHPKILGLFSFKWSLLQSRHPPDGGKETHMKYALMTFVAMALSAGALRAAIKTQEVDYEQGGTKLKGFLAYDDAIQGKRPGVVIYPEFWGLNDYAKHRAQMLAELGYVAFAADLYGNGQVTEVAQEAGKMSGALKANRALLRERANAGLEQLKKNEFVDPEKLAAIGYCFGGTTAIELARSGADVKAVVTFHAGLDSPSPADGKNIMGSLLVCHGGDDMFSSEKDIDAFKQEMRENHVDWQMNVYGGAVHSFTNPGADKHGIPGVAYNEKADKRSWRDMQLFFNGAFGVAGPGH
jgi:dienelactone hydrolase